MLQCCETRPAKARRVVCLYANEATQERLRVWATDRGFDLGWNYDGWPIDPDLFRFHLTLVASENEVEIEDRWQPIGPLTVSPAGFAVLGADRRVPVLEIAKDDKLVTMRRFFVEAYGITPTFDEFRPHVSLSYRWDGAPALPEEPPPFPLVFDALVVSVLTSKPRTKDAAMPDFRDALVLDQATIGGTRRTKDGYLVADIRAARTGIQQYAGAEVGRPDLAVVSVYRPDEEVFSRDSLASYGFKPVTVGHPTVGVTADNWRDLAVGNLGGDVVRDGGFVRVPLVLMDAAAIAEVEAGRREVSMGYDVRLEFVDGVTPEGEPYQAIQRDIRINHCAIVDRARAGNQCRIGDKGALGARERKPVNPRETQTMQTRKIVVDGLTIETTDQGVEAITKLQTQVTDTEKRAADALKALEGATKTIADMKVEHEKALDAAKKLIPTADHLEAMLDRRVEVVDGAKRLAPTLECKGKSAADIRRAVVSERLGDGATKDRSDDYVGAQFDALVKLAGSNGGVDRVADALASAAPANSQANDARAKYLSDQANAWAS